MCKRVFDETIELADNAMLKVKPELFDEWDFEKNDALGLDIYRMKKGSEKFVWWKCNSCKSEYDMSINKRAIRNSNCPYCAGRRVNHTNSLAVLCPELALEWHPTLNGAFTPHNFTSGSREEAWWQCSIPSHEWKTEIKTRAKAGNKCPYCSNQKLLMGFNDMWSTNPELAKLLANPEDGYKYMQCGSQKVNWKCPDCNNRINQKTINNIKSVGLSCPKCSDGRSYAEKFLYNLLLENNINFKYDEIQSWSGRMRYDFYLPDFNWIIEVHGEQHYRGGFESLGGKNLEEEIENDMLKKELAHNNNISNYIVLNAEKPTVGHLEKSILESKIVDIIPRLNAKKIGAMSSSSFIKRACDLWNSGITCTPKIAKKMKISRQTVSIYLKRGVEIGWCDYCPRKEASKAGLSQSKTIIQLSLSSKFIKQWGSMSETERQLGIGNSNISSVCRGKQKTAGGFKWMYKEDYDKLIAEQNDSISITI